jgi:hypothetical protein
MNLILFKAGYSPVVIGPEHRVDYINGLERISGRRSRPSGDLRCTKVHKGRCLDGYGVWKFALEASQLRKDLEAYRQFMTARLIASLEHHLAVLRQGRK